MQPWLLQRLYEGNLCVPGSAVYSCPGGTVCAASSSPQYSSESVCCFPGRINCHGSCRDACAPGYQINPVTCVCEAVCPPCPAVGMIQDPQTCACRCPHPGEIPCNGVCIDPLTDETFCGGCPGTPCSPVDELCCNGVCTRIGTKQDCTDCNDPVPAGWDCCDYVPTQLGTNQHCRSCTEHCTGGRTCISPTQGCQCPSGSRLCGGICWPNNLTCCNDVRCSATQQGCCNNTCTDLNTNRNNCGACGRRCDVFEICSGGQCICPPGGIVCHGRCCVAPFLNCAPVANPNSAFNCCTGNVPSQACNDPRRDCCPVGTVCCAAGCC